jgi:hypothetical protein
MHKDKTETKGEWAEIEELEIQPLTDSDLEAVLGGAGTICSVHSCSVPGCDY